jgi:glycosyltransferase involved in cell wall biosynthesis
MAHELVSIALCTYNGAAYLKEQLDTLINQTYPNLEIIVVDDCSTDDTVGILKQYANSYHQIKLYVNSNNLGYTKNFEKAIHLCNGEYIALCDQDDLWHPQKIELQVNNIADNVFIYHDSEFIHENGISMNKKMSDIMNLYRGDQPEAFLFFNCVSGHSILMKRNLIDAALPLKKDFFHDWWLSYVATSIGKIDFIPKCLVQYRQHDNSETNILKLSRAKDNYGHTAIQNSEKIEKWTGYCAAFRLNKNPELIKEFYEAYKIRNNSYFSFKLAALFLKHWKVVLYIRKKSSISKLNYIRKHVIGLEFKKIFKR